ncbi:MAG: 30S ribosomal protein S4 [Candidatus Schekmanbacteria bacterium]|nr:30S ribosomal protein S4 [Candidatus Schekmanbacteria bacterium]
MARYTGPVCRFCRREGERLFLKGARCHSEKCGIEKRAYPPGQHGRRRSKLSDYGVQLREKQKMRRLYGLLEKQFRSYYESADAQKGVTGENLIRLLERRLDNMVYRMKLGVSRSEARQLVRHGHLTVNGKKVDIPSYLLREGDVVAVAESSKNVTAIRNAIESSGRRLPEWIELDVERLVGRVTRFPDRSELDLPFKEQLVVELYSK